MKQRTVLLFLAFLLLVAGLLLGALFGARQARLDYSPENGGNAAENSGESVPPSTEPEQQEAPREEEARVSFFAAGDVVLHESVFLDANLRAGGEGRQGSVDADSPYDFLPMYSRVAAAIARADVAMVNQETLIAAASDGVPRGYPNFTGPAAAGDALVSLGFDVVNIGNNHMLDQSTAGLLRSLSYWQEQSGVSVIGAYSSREECDQLTILEREGIRIAILPYLGHTPGTNGYSADDSVCIPYLDEELVRRQMEFARKSADLVVVTVHWGDEGTYTPNREQKTYAELFATLGADVLIGTHPHVLQPMSWVERTGYEGGGRMLLCYSLGDFLSHTQLGGSRNQKGNLLGGYVTFDIVKKDGATSLENVVFVPTVSHYDKGDVLDTGFVIYPLSEYTDALLSRFGDRSAGFTSVSQLEEIVKLNISQEFLR